MLGPMPATNRPAALTPAMRAALLEAAQEGVTCWSSVASVTKDALLRRGYIEARHTGRGWLRLIATPAGLDALRAEVST